MVDIISIMRFQDIKGIATKLGISTFKYIVLRKSGKKHCYICNKWIDENNFRKDSSKVDGMSPRCRSCEQSKDKKFACSFEGKFISYKKEAKRRGLEFLLSKSQFNTFWNKRCFYCGNIIETIGIDRIDSNIGYTVENCVPCCYKCNTMKLDLSEKEWITHMMRILKHRGVI